MDFIHDMFDPDIEKRYQLVCGRFNYSDDIDAFRNNLAYQ